MSNADQSPISLSSATESDASSIDDGDDDDFEKPDTKSAVNLQDTIVDDNDNCSICFEPWTSSGEHKICCLRCGHLFGLRWIKSQGKNARCPQCNSFASRNHIRLLYSKNLKVLDTTERDQALNQLSLERQARHKAEVETAEVKAKFQLLHSDYLKLQDEADRLRTIASSTSSLSTTSSWQKTTESGPDSNRIGHYELVKNVLISSVNTIDYRISKYIHLHSQPIRDLAFNPQSHDALLASASLDKTVRLTSLLSDQIVQTYACPAPVWSCCWASSQSNRLFAGCSNGSILVLDVRITSGPLATLPSTGSSSPVIGLQYINASQPSLSSSDQQALLGGLLIGQLIQVSFLPESSQLLASLNPVPSGDTGSMNTENTPTSRSGSPDLMESDDDPTRPPSNLPLATSSTTNYVKLAFDGSLSSLSSASPLSSHFLASFRPSVKLPRVRHVLAELQLDPTINVNPSGSTSSSCSFKSHELHNLWAGSRMKMLTRARLFDPGQSDLSKMVAVAGSEDTGVAIIWRCDTGDRLQTIKPPGTSPDEPVIDACFIFPSTSSSDSSGKHSRHQLALLTERSVSFYLMCID